MARKPPAFQCYASNIISLMPYRLMTLEERGLWITLYLECWVNESIPADTSKLAKYIGVLKEDVDRLLSASVKHFYSFSQDEIRCPELDDYRAELAQVRKKQADGGKLGQENKRKKLLKSSSKSLEGGVSSSLDKSSLDKASSVVDSSIDSWIHEFEKSPTQFEYLRQSRGS